MGGTTEGNHGEQLAVKTFKTVRSNWFWLLAGLIIVFAAILRFYNFPSRFAFGEDQARDILVVREIVETRSLPLVGPPSSAGPFNYGPWYYWFLTLISLIVPFTLTPWILVTFVSLLFVFVLILTGRTLDGNITGIIAGLLAAVSTAEIRVSAHLADVSFVSIFAGLAILNLILFLKQERGIFAFFVGLSTGFAINMHFSALGLLPFLLIGLIPKSSKTKNLLLLLLGFFIPFIPFLIFNLIHNWIIVKNLLSFFLSGQEKFWVSVRWFTYLRDFWPELWASVIGGFKLFSYLILVFFAVFLVKDLYKRKLDKSLIALLVVFTLQVVMLRYWRGERQTVWFLFLNPSILVLTTWVVWKVFNCNKIAAIFLLTIMITGSMIQDFTHLHYINQFSKINALKEILLSTYPNSSFLLHNCGHSSTRGGSIPLLLLLEKEKKIDPAGKLIGVFMQSSQEEMGMFQYNIIAKRNPYVITEFEPEKIPSECTAITQASVYEETVFANIR